MPIKNITIPTPGTDCPAYLVSPSGDGPWPAVVFYGGSPDAAALASVIASAGFGAVGFCMGGGMAIAAAATYPHRFSAVASFHGGHLATDGPTSPHLLVPSLAAQVYIASAENDDSYPPAMAACLEGAMTRAGVRYRSEIYRNASHGWMVPDFPVYDQVSADRGWEAMLAFFSQALAS